MPLTYKIGSWTFSPSAARLAAGDDVRQLTPQQLAVLAALLAAPDHTLSKEALLAQAWPGKVVSDDAITRVISDLRKLLDGTKDQQNYIKTLHGFGYQLEAPVSSIEAAPPARPKRRRLALASLALVLAGAGAAIFLLREKPGTLEEWPVAIKAHQLALAPDEQYIAHPVLDEQVSLRPNGLGTDIVLRDAAGRKTLATVPARIVSASSSPGGKSLAFIALDGGCTVQVIALGAPGAIRTLASCSASTGHALAWRDDQTVLTVSGSRQNGFALITLPLAEQARVEALPAACDAVTGLAAGANQELYLNCESGGASAIMRLRQGKLASLFRYRTVRKFAVDQDGNVYMVHQPGWKGGITRYDAARGTFSFASTGWVADLAVAGDRLIVVRDMANADLLATRLASLAFESIESGKIRSAAFAVDPDSGKLWQIDDRAGPFALYRDQQLVKLDGAIDVDLSSVVGMRVREARRELVLQVREGEAFAELTIGLSGAGTEPLPVLHRGTANGKGFAPLEVSTAKGKVRIAGAGFEETDAGGRMLRQWQDKRISAPYTVTQLQYDKSLDRLLFLTQPPSYRDIASIDLSP